MMPASTSRTRSMGSRTGWIWIFANMKALPRPRGVRALRLFLFESHHSMSKICDELNPKHQGILCLVGAVWPDDVLDIRLDRVVVGEVNCVTGFQHMLGRRALPAHRNDGITMVPAEAADEIGQQKLVAISSRNEALPDRAGEPHEWKERNVLLWRKGKTTPETEIRVRIRNASPKHLLPHGVKTIGIRLGVGSIKLGKFEIRIVATKNVIAGKFQCAVHDRFFS